MARDITAELEALVDATSLLHVLTGLELIAYEKAEHLRVNWQDRASAKHWDNAGKVVGNAARNAKIGIVS